MRTLSMPAPSLLLLPSTPQPPTRPTLAAAYRAPLTAVLARLKDPTSPSTLVIALATPLLAGAAPRVKTLRWRGAQSLLAGLYTLVAVLCAEQSIATDIGAGPGSIDVRIILVDHDRTKTYYPDHNGAYGTNCTTVLDLPAFASSVYPWKTVFHPSSEEGYELLSAYLKFAEGRNTLLQHQLVAVPGGVSLSTEEPAPNGASEGHDKGYATVCLGGTFDHLHPGHKLLLHATALLLKVPEKDSATPCELIVGISGDELLVNKKYASELQPWSHRAASALSFLATLLNLSTSDSPPETTQPSPDELHAVMRNGTIRVRCVNIHDPFGPTISEEKVDAIVVSGETRSGGAAINDRRTGKGWKPLDVFEIDVLDARGVDEADDAEATRTEDFAAKISSTAIRQRKAEAKVNS